MTDQLMKKVKKKEFRKPPAKSQNIVTDVKNFFLNIPETPTLVEINSDFERNRYIDLIYERTGIAADEYRVVS